MSSQLHPRLLDEDAAFRAMCVYLEAYWKRGLRSSDDIAQLLIILHGDPATPDDWANAVDQVVDKRP
ncbi:hypothetical protein D9601_00325 [Sphingomonas sp. MA1305]|uniref:hypothetical protein n=1 Tax=Sphingomonas sp. MA1305 TaxID=2479204 RepID=UPI0018DFB3F6|nr:hypothetical protein [Sphingomonas sp. MA1305]MBI0473808.1 hypothetical protein [Sphingomonas sp. MA1305]